MTLTEINYNVRKMAPFAVIVILVLLTIFFAVRLFLIVSNLDGAQQPGTTVNTVSINPIFNKITLPEIEEAGTSGNFSYVVDTLDGTTNPENATAAASVFFLQKPGATFGFLDQIYSLAKSVGIDTEMTKHSLDDRIATFDDGQRKLVIDIDTLNFSYEYYIDRDEAFFDREVPTLASQAESLGSNFLRKMNKYNEELSQGKRNIIYLRYDKEAKQISTQEEAAGANMIEVDFYRPDIMGIPIVTTTYYNSPHYVMVGTKGTSPEIVRAQVRLFEKSKDQIGTYPLRTGAQAWTDLESGKGLVVSSPQPDGEIKIKKIFLAYYDPDIYQEYMQPVYVFLGENKFVAYVPAVTEEYLLIGAQE